MFSLSCVIQSHSHIFDEKALSVLMNDAMLTQVVNVARTQIEVAIKSEKSNFSTIEEFYPKAHLIASCFVIALNVSSLGHFTWASGNQLYPTYEVAPVDRRQRVIFSTQRHLPYDGKVLTEAEVEQTMIIFGSVMREKDETIRTEYVKGILHMGLSFAEINFDKEAFANFYRSFEYFVTRKILLVKKLNNEVKEIAKAIRSSGLSDEFVPEFSKLYKIRSAQVMHAQLEQTEITQDDVIKMKVFIDYFLHQHYTRIPNIWLEKQRNPESDR